MSKRLTEHERACRALSERDFQWAYTKVLHHLDLKVAHHYDSRFSDNGTRGFPDLVVVGPYGLCFIELKRELGQVSPSQTEWHMALMALDHEVRIYRPSDWDYMLADAAWMATGASREMFSLPADLRAFPVPRKRQTSKRRKPSTTLESESEPSSQP